MPDASDTTSIEHQALTLTVRTPQCGHTVWEIDFGGWGFQARVPEYSSFVWLSRCFLGFSGGAA